MATFPELPKPPQAQQLTSMLVGFPEFGPKLQELLLTLRGLAGSPECLGPLKGPCHSDYMLVRIPKHEKMEPAHTVQQLHKSDILRDTKSSRDIQKL